MMKKLFFAGVAFFAIVVAVAALFFFSVFSHLPDVASLKHYRPSSAAEVLDKDGNVLTQYYDRKFRIWVPISSLPDIIVKAVVTAEDDTFFEHRGVNYRATWDALVLDVQKRRFARGGSTITQQMIKNVLLSKEKTITRKLREYVLARKAEELLSKRKILEIYLNEVEWGDNIYGIEAASRYYLDKHASDLTIAESALLAGMLPNPRYYNPIKRLDKAKDRQERVLFNMQQAKLITPEEYAAALSASITLRREGGGTFDFAAHAGGYNRPCYQRALEQMLETMYGEHELYRGGMMIQTTLDKKLQEGLQRSEGSSGTTGKEPGTIMVIQQEGKIRAIVCSEGRESESRKQLEEILPAINNGAITLLSPEQVSREQIIVSASPSGTVAPR